MTFRPNPNGLLSASVSPATIKEANEAVKSVTSRVTLKFSPEQQAAMGKYASLHDNQAAIQHFSKQLGGIFFRLHVEY